MSKNFTLLRKVGREQDIFQTPDRPPTVLDTMECAQAAAQKTTRQDVSHHELQPHELPRLEAPHREVPQQQPQPRNPALPRRWPDAFKAKIGSVGQQAPNRGQRSDLETIRYREQVKLVQRIFPLNAQSTPQLVLFSSLESEAETGSIAARSAEILAARAEGPVCVVDANLQWPLVHRYFGVENCRGFSDSFCEPGPAQDFALRLSNNNLWVMPTGSAAAQPAVSEFSKCVSSRMMELRTLFKYIVVNAPLHLDRLPALQNFAADGVVLVVEANTTRRESVRQLLEELQMVGVRVLGVVLNNRTFPIPDAIYHKF
jgi:hypothetical protein